jgi:hypothetical protein
MSIFHNNILGGAAGQGGDFTIERSLRFNSGDSAYLSRTPSSTGDRRTFTISGWVKRSKVGSQQPIFSTYAGAHPTTALLFNGDDKLWFYNYDGSYNFQLVTAARFRDPGAWMHFVVAVDSTQTAPGARVKIYVNGEWIEDDFDTSSYPSPSFQLDWNNQTEHNIGKHVNFLDGYLAEFHHVDGTQLAASDFGEYDDNGIWQAKKYSGSYGTNGFHLDFSDNSSITNGSNAGIGKDTSGSGNYFNSHNISVTSGIGNDSLIDTPTNYEGSGNNGGNYATLNPLHNGQALSNGNLDVVGTSSWQRSVSTIIMSSGKWYWEYEITASNEHIVGVGPLDMQMSGNLGAGDPPGSGYLTEIGSVNGTGANGSWSNTGGSSTGDVLGVAFDADAGNMYIYKNGTPLNSGAASHTGLTNGPYYAVFSLNGSSRSGTVNFGQRPFKYTNAGTNRPAATYLSLCTANLTDPTIEKPSDYFDVKKYEGTGSTQAITGLNFSPDLIWIKNRTVNDTHAILDTHRDTNIVLSSNLTNGDRTESGSVTAFGTNGFTVGGYNDTNRDESYFVAFTWDAGDSPTTLTAGTMDSSVRRNTSAGFSMCTYTSPNSSSNQSFAHGLNAKPDFVLVKNRDRAYNWDIYHSSRGYSSSFTFTDAGQRSGAFSAEPTSTLVNTKNDYTHYSTDDYIAYCWSAVYGYSQFGKYVGNGSSDGPFVGLSFTPKWVMVKGIVSSTHWRLWDSVREPRNPKNLTLTPSDANHETVYGNDDADFLSNGFKIRSTGSYSNSSNVTYVYAAFAEHPFSLNGGLAR